MTNENVQWVGIDHVQVAIPVGSEDIGAGLLRRRARPLGGPQTAGDGRARGRLVRIR